MKANYLDPYRRHLDSCAHRHKGQDFTLCRCPIWAYGRIGGAPYRRTLQTNDWPRAQRRIELLLSENNPASLQPSTMVRSISAAVTSYLVECAKRNLKPRSIASYTQTLARLTSFCGTQPLSRLDVDLLSRFRNSRTVKPRTQRKELQCLRAFCAFCTLRGWIQGNPAQQLKTPRIESLATLPFTREETDRLIAACSSVHARALVSVLLYSGLRIGDIATLRRARLESTGHLVLHTEKTGVPVKVLLHADAIRDLQALPAPGGNPTYFFWSGKGKPDVCATSLWRTISRLGSIAGVHAHPHRFRDTFAVELISNGADIRTVQKLLGHSSIKTTEMHYAHFVPAHQKLLDTAVATLDFRLQPAKPLLVGKSRRK